MLDAVLPAGLEPASAALLAVVSFGTSLITAVFGIGGGVALLAVMATLVPPLALIPVHGVVQLASNAGRAALLRAHVSRPALALFSLGALLGAGLGGLIAVDLAPWVVHLSVGLFVLWSVLARPPRWMARWPALSGAVSSFLTMFFGATGPFVAAGVKALGLNRQGHVATSAAMMTVQHGLKTLVFALLGFAFGQWVGVIALLAVTGFAGTWVGTHLLARQSDAGFQRALNIVLILLALRLIWMGLNAAGA